MCLIHILNTLWSRIFHACCYSTYISVPVRFKQIPIVRRFFLEWECAQKRPQKHIGNHWQKKQKQTSSNQQKKNLKKCTNGFGSSREAHKYCCIVRVSILGNLLAGVTSCTIWLWLPLGAWVINPRRNEGSKNTFNPVFPPTLPNSAPHLPY